MATGPNSGYLAMLHGPELVTPMSGPAANNNPMVAKLSMIYEETALLRRDFRAASQHAANQRSRMEALEARVEDKIGRLASGGTRGVI